MKWGNTLLAEKAKFSESYAQAFFDYGRQKQFLKKQAIPASLAAMSKTAVVEDGEDDVATLAAERLASLSVVTRQFFGDMNKELKTVTGFYGQEKARLEKKHAELVASSAVSDMNAQPALALLQEIQVLEKYAILSMTSVSKILKKFSKLTGLGSHIPETYMMQLMRRNQLMSSSQSSLGEMKAALLASAAVVAHAEAPMSPIPPPKELAVNLTKGMPRSGTGHLPLSRGNSIGSEADAARNYSQSSLAGPSVPHLAVSSHDDMGPSASQVLAGKGSLYLEPAHAGSAPLLREGKTPTPWFPQEAYLASQRVLITLAGPHGTDIIGAMLKCLKDADVSVADFSFSRLHHNVTFAVLVEVPSSGEQAEFVKALASAAKAWHATLLFDAQDKDALPPSLEDAPYDNRAKYAATVLDFKGLTPAFLSDYTQLLLGYKVSVERMARLNSTATGKMTSIDYKLSIPREVDVDKFRTDLFAISVKYGADISLQEANVFRRSKRLVVFDMDSTLIQQEVIDEIARHAGVVEKVAEITELAMRGEIQFAESLKRRVALLKGTPATVLDAVRQVITFNNGARELCRCLKRLGFKLAVISGGFLPLANYVKAELGLDYAFANNLRVASDGTFTGETIGPIVTGERKAELLEVIAQAENVTLEQVIAVGDGANDLWMLAAAGLGIAFNAKPKVQERARTRINQNSLMAVLYLLGYSDEDVVALMNSP